MLSFNIYAQTLTDTTHIVEPISYNTEITPEEDFFEYFVGSYKNSRYNNAIQKIPVNFISMRYRLRGYDNRFSNIYVNGVEMVDMADGSVFWNFLTGARGITYLENEGDNTPNIGEKVFITTYDPTQNQFVKVGYANTNRSYAHRLNINTLLKSNKSGISTSIAINRRMGEDNFSKGVWSDLTTGTISLRKDFSKEHAISLFYTGTYGNQGIRSAATQGVYDLADDNFYNPNWGMFSDKLRNSKVRGYGQNMAVLSYSYTSDNFKIEAGISGIYGKNSISNLTWYDTPTPYPDYYRYLPDFFGNTTVSDMIRDQWNAKNLDVAQINWKNMIESNQLNVTSDGTRSHYMVADNVTNKTYVSAFADMTYNYSNNLKIRGGIRLRRDKSDNFSKVTDLLGGDYWTDIDQYLIDDEYYSDMIQNDIRNPNRKVRVGDKFGYDYNLNTDYNKFWIGANYRTVDWSADAILALSDTKYTRTGFYEKEMYSGAESYGNSKTPQFRNYTAQINVQRHIAANQAIGVNLMAGDLAPLATDIFVSLRYRNAIINNPKKIGIVNAEIYYNYVVPDLSINVSAYYSKFSGSSDIISYYDDISSLYSNLVMTDIDKQHIGIELGAEYWVTKKFSLLGALSYNRYTYASDPTVNIFSDRDGSPIISNSQALLKNFRLSGTPQSAALVELRYRLPMWWTISGSIKYSGENYVSINPIRRMTRSLDLIESPEIISETLDQEMLGTATTVNLSLSKNFRFKNKQSIGIWINVENLLNNKNIRYGGYEQMRFSKSSKDAGYTLNPFPSKYYYAYGTNYYCSITYTF